MDGDPWQIIVPGENPDKADHEKAKDNDDPINYLHPFALFVAGRPNSGKTTYALGVAARQTPPFERVVIMHSDGEASEYTSRGVQAEVVSELPPIDSWTSGKKELLIVDDVDVISKARGKQAEVWDRTWGYARTHRGLSIICTAQNFVHQLPINIRRMGNVYAFWLPTDRDAIYKFARAAEQSQEVMEALMDLVREQRDTHAFLVVNMTGRGPTYLLNGTRPISVLEDGEELL
jgi:hypothetical protein